MSTKTKKKEQTPISRGTTKQRTVRRSPGSPRKAVGGQRWVVNFRLLGLTAGFLVVVVAGLYFWSQFQVDQQADALLNLAQKQNDEGEVDESIGSYRRYIALRPSDAIAFADYVKLYVKQEVPTYTKIQKCEEALAKLRLDPEAGPDREAEMQFLAARYLFERARDGRVTAYLNEASALLGGLQTPEAAKLLAQCTLSLRELDPKQDNPDKLVEQLARAHELNVADPDMCLEYARAMRDGLGRTFSGWTAERRRFSAEAEMNALTTDHKDDPFAWLAQFLFFMDSENRAAAKPCIEKALALVSEGDFERDYVVYSRAALFAVANNDTAAALKHFKMSIDNAPKDIEQVDSLDDRLALNQAFTSYAALLYREKQVDLAIEVLDDARLMMKSMSFQPEHMLTEILTEEGRVKEAWAPLNRLKDRYSSKNGTMTQFMATRDLDAISAVLLRAEARLLQAEGRYHEAIEVWDRYVIALGPSVRTQEVAEQRMDAHLNAAQCYVIMQDYDSAEKQAVRANDALGDNSRVAFFMGMIEEKRGKISSALKHYSDALLRRPVFYPAREGYARVLFSLARASGQQPDWDQFESQIPDLEALPPAEKEKWAMFRAEAAMTQNDYDQAAKILKEARIAQPKSTRIIEALALNAATAGNQQQADVYAAELKDISELRYNVLAYEFHSRKDENEQAEAALQAAIGMASGNERLALERVLAEFELTRLNKPDQGRTRLAAIAKRLPSDLPTYRRLVELAIAADAMDEAQEYLAEVEKVEGEGGATVLYLQARIALRNGNMDKAKRDLEVLRGMRNRWAPVSLLKALIAEEEGELADAVLAYQDAVRYGERNPAVASKIYQLLSELNRYADADAFLQEISSESREIGLAASLRDRNFSQAVTYAKADLDANPDELRNWIRYGSALVFADKLDEAQAAFEQGLTLDATSPQALIQLVGCNISKYRKTGSPEDLAAAKLALERFVRDADAQPETLSFLAAQCHQLLGDGDEAAAQYRRALSHNGNKDMTMLRTAGTFFASRDRDFAIELLRDAKKIDPDAADITRLLAVLYSEAGTQEDWQLAWDMLVEEAGGEGGDLDDRRLMALMMLRTGNPESQYQAAKVMEEVIAESVKKSPNDEQLLAEIYEKTGNLDKALEKMRALNSAQNPTIDAQQYLVQLLIRSGEYEEAEKHLAKMHEAKSVPLGFLIYSYCDIAKSRGEPQKIDGLLASYIEPELEKEKENTVLQAQMMMAAADLAETFDRQAAAENWHKRRLALVDRTFVTYGVWLAEQRRVSEAVDLCLKYAKPDDAGSMVGLLTVLTVAGAPPVEMDRVNPLLDKAIQQCSEEVDFLIALATLRQIQRLPREAIVLYERALQRSNQTNITALNNLALLLSGIDGRGDQALRHINKAINSRGTDNTALLDTKASVLIALNRYDDALALMRRIVLRVDDNPVYYLHLAECQLQTGDREGALRSLSNAEEKKIDSSVLTAIDAEMLSKLRAELLSTQASVQ